MASRPFAYNPGGSPIPGTTQVGNLTVAAPGWPNHTEHPGINFYEGPAEGQGAIIVGYPDPGGNHFVARERDGNGDPIGAAVNANIGFVMMTNPVAFMMWTQEYLSLPNMPNTGDEAYTLLTNAGVWTNYEEINRDYYASNDIEAVSSNDLYTKMINTRSVKNYIATNIGGQSAVPEAFAFKVARVYQLLLNPNGTDIDGNLQNDLLKVLAGITGWHAGQPAIQRIARGGGSSYTPNFLYNPTGYAGLEALYDSSASEDMVWYLNSSTTPGDGDLDAVEVLEHVMHTIHMLGVAGMGSLSYNPNDPSYTTTALYAAMAQAINNGMYQPVGLGANWQNGGDAYPLAVKEYLYLLNFGMHEYCDLWDGGSLAPEWSTAMNTPNGILTNNPLGHALWQSEFNAVIDKIPLSTLRSIFQDGDVGDPTIAGSHGYIIS
tara:strand:+ start:493 stop:1791 length:1299 start_codon:yes stop_codon:yes gene_type:complete